MQTARLIKQNLAYYWRTNLAVVFGVATAVAVLAGALLVGDSVRASLHDLFQQRLGNTDLVITAPGFFREQLAADVQNHAQFVANGLAANCPLIALDGTVTHEPSKRVGSSIRVYGVDERFWKFHSRTDNSPHGHEVLLSDGLARELGTHPGDSLLLRIQKPSDIPIESLHSRKEDLGNTVRLTVRDTLATDAMGEFSVQPQQGAVRAVFVPLNLLQKELGREDKVNIVLVAEASANDPAATQIASTAALTRILKDTASLEDYGIKVRAVNEQHTLQVESSTGMIPDSLVEIIGDAAQSAKMFGPTPYLSYLVNSIRKDDGREIPYSIVTGVTRESIEVMQHGEFGHLPGCNDEAGQAPTRILPPILLNEWAGSDLQSKVGDRVTLDYYLWLQEGKLVTRSAEFRVACVIPMQGGPDLVPDYPGITSSESLSDWDPPFPIDLKRVRRQDEDYWKKHRTTPKAFIPLAIGQELWGSRFGKLTSLRLLPKSLGTLGDTPAAFKRSLLGTIDPQQTFAILPVRAQGLAASQGATDFGEYFLYFSFFLVISALLLAALFFKLGVEQRLREIGLLQAVGFPASRIRTLFLSEGMLLGLIGSGIGLVGALGYAQLLMFGLRTWWVDAVGTTMLILHVSAQSLLLGGAGGVLASLVCIVWTLRQVGKSSTRSLLSGAVTLETNKPERGARRRRLFTKLRVAIFLILLGLLLLVASSLHLIGQVAGFFGGALLLLVAFLCFESVWLRRDGRRALGGTGWWSVSRLGFRNATSRPGRSILCIALIASAAFIIVAVDSFRHRGNADETRNPHSGSGGFPLLAESLLPLVHDPNSREGREALNLAADDAAPLSGVTFARFRVRPGDDASCLNLYQPRNPKIIAPTDDFIKLNRFAFQNSLASTSEEKQNPWLLLNREFPDGAVPVIADANSMTYVLHLKLGDDFVLQHGERTVRLRLVAALADSIFQSELVMGEKNFLREFPDQEGYRFFLIDTRADQNSSAIAAALEDRLADFGFDVQQTSERLASFHRVENTYLSTFQMLGALGLLLGTLGMAAVLLRNVLERQRELALLRAVGYNSTHFTLMVVAENALLLGCGLVTGTVCALLAIAPVFFTEHAQLPSLALGLLLLAVLISGLMSSIVATWAALRSPVLPALRAE